MSPDRRGNLLHLLNMLESCAKARFGFGSGIMQHAHQVGEVLDLRELQHAIAFLARYPGVFAAV